MTRTAQLLLEFLVFCPDPAGLLTLPPEISYFFLKFSDFPLKVLRLLLLNSLLLDFFLILLLLVLSYFCFLNCFLFLLLFFSFLFLVLVFDPFSLTHLCFFSFLLFSLFLLYVSTFLLTTHEVSEQVSEQV